MINNAIRLPVMKRLTGSAGVKQRTRIRQRDKYTCRICDIAVRIGEVDHIIALTNGGTNDDSNLWLLCRYCHDDKTRKDLGYKTITSIDANGMPINGSHHWNR